MAALDEIRFRAARASDAQAVAGLMVEAGGGLFEFLLEGVLPGKTPAEVLALAVAGDSDPCSYKDVRVAEIEGRVVAMINAYPAQRMKAEPRDLLPKDRLDHIKALDEVQDWGSFFISSMAVAAEYRHRGIAKQLLRWACEQAAQRGFDRVSLHVWAANGPARRLYESQGFVIQDRASIAPHPRLAQSGDSLLMVRQLAA